jgi:hypothetical protein
MSYAKLINKEKKEIMGKIVVKNAIKREKGFLYYIDGKGNLCSAKMARRRKK